MTALTSSSVVRHHWHQAVVDRLQKAIGHALDLDRNDVPDFLMSSVNSLETPASGAERLLLRGILVEFASDCGARLHDREHSTEPSAKRCTFEPRALLNLFWTPRSVEPIRAFTTWTAAFFAALDATHPRSAASRAARLIRDNYSAQLTVDALSSRVHMTPSRLTRTFREEYGMSVAEYQRLARLLSAIEHIREIKVDAIAVAAGYRSKKNFIRAFKQFTGLTPTDFRKLPEESARHTIESARMTLMNVHRSEGHSASRKGTSTHAADTLKHLAADQHQRKRQTRE